MTMFDPGPPVPPSRQQKPTKSASTRARSSVASNAASAGQNPCGRVVRVVPDVGAISRHFDYVVPSSVKGGDSVEVGSLVRVPLHGRSVKAWVVAVDVEPPPGVVLKPISKFSSFGPPAELVELAQWAAWRWAGPVAGFLDTASPPTHVTTRPSEPTTPAGPTSRTSSGDAGIAQSVARAGRAAPDRGGTIESVVVERVPPGQPVMPVIRAAVEGGPALVLVPSLGAAEVVARQLRREGHRVALHPRGWAEGASGATVVGTRAAAWAPVAGLHAVVVVDEHDEAYQEERAPTWHARDVAIERARRAGVPCTLTSPCPTLEALRHGELRTPSRGDERAGWPATDVVDRRREDQARLGLYSDALVRGLRNIEHGRVLCVLNRTGRARLLACRSCGDLARCERCTAALIQVDDGALSCLACGLERPAVCATCGATKLKARRLGVARVRDELEALAGEPVAEITATTGKRMGSEPADAASRLGSGEPPGSHGPDALPAVEARIVVGTEAVLHRELAAAQASRPRRQPVGFVAFLDFDQELLAPRYRAAEQALALLARAGRLLGRRDRGGRLLVQTTLPDHPVLQAALRADPTIVSEEETARRIDLDLPPFTATASVSGEAAEAFIAAFGEPAGVDVLGPADARWLLRAPDHSVLCDALANTARPPGRLRIEVDPLRI